MNSRNQPILTKGQQLAILQAQRSAQSKHVDLYQAARKHKVMKRTFKGIMSYPQRKLLFEIGQNRV